MVGQVDLEQVETLVDGLGKTESVCEHVDGPGAGARHRSRWGERRGRGGEVAVSRVLSSRRRIRDWRVRNQERKMGFTRM